MSRGVEACPVLPSLVQAVVHVSSTVCVPGGLWAPQVQAPVTFDLLSLWPGHTAWPRGLGNGFHAGTG